ncbi:jmjC domain-containing protein 8 isoform X2 [Antechinus flavipes]|uniref:jmjC domain-containing protein 8 isoform X2 n=1 Tax=Antechinus flavipes TaxID=38775 RepID=UPI002235BE10|nr:jmjC domain-containing protein 8 isoform X2 [Antechinus flavipes]
MLRGGCGGPSVRRSCALPGSLRGFQFPQPSEGSVFMELGRWRCFGMWFLFLTLIAFACLESGTPVSGGWELSGHLALEEEEQCTVDRRANLTYAEFIHQYAFSRPVILQRLTNNSLFQDLCSKEKLLAEFGDFRIRLSTANTYSYQKVDLSFQEYVEQLLEPQDPKSLGNGVGSGVPFHWHGPGYSEVIFGRKRWFLYPPEKRPDFHPNKTTLSWLRDTYPALPITERPLQCTVQAGEVRGVHFIG